MKVKFTLIIISLLFISCYKVHPLKLTNSMIEYDKPSKSLKIETRVFIDDFTSSLNKEMSSKINVSSLSKDDNKKIEKYFTKYFYIKLNSKVLKLKFSSSSLLIDNNLFIINFTCNSLELKKGDSFVVNNTLLCKEFGAQQKNMHTVLLPPFLSQSIFETKHDKPYKIIQL